MQHRGPVAVVPAGGHPHAANGLTKTTTTTIRATSSSPNMDSTLSLVKQLVTHFVEASFAQCRVRDRDQEEAFKGKLKVLVYSILLSHRKDHARENSCLRLNELEEVIWHTHVLRQQRRFDDGNALDSCLHALRKSGHLEAGSDVRTVMRLLVALKGQGGPEGEVQQPVLAELRPRIVHQEENTPSFLPSGPLQYGDTFLQKAEAGRPYITFPSTLYTHLPVSLSQGWGGTAGRSTSPFDIEEMIRLSRAPPGTGISPLLTGESVTVEEKRKVLGALLKESKKEVSPNMVLSLPKLPNNAKNYNPFSISSSLTTITATTTSPSGNSAAGGDEGYASSHSAASHSPKGEEEDPWEAVLAALPLTSHRSWATLGHIPEGKEKPFIFEAGTETTHNVWLLYQELWSIVGGQSIPQLCVRPVKELCQDMLYLLIGVPSHSFPWSDAEESFSIKEGLCHPSITPEALRGSLLPFVECGTLVRRLEMLCSTPKFDTQHVLTQGSVFIAFIFAISSVLQTYREKVLDLGSETLLSALQDKAEPLVKKIKFIASLCKVSSRSKKAKQTANTSLSGVPGINITKEIADTTLGNVSKRQWGKVDENPAGLPRGLCLLGELLSRITATKDHDCLILLISIFKSSCMPFFRYLEEWIYQGMCSDPGAEFIIEVNGAALLRRDRTYWTSGYTLRPQASIPTLFRDVLEEAFVCGKTLNLLRLCSSKHYLVSGSNSQPAMQLCVSGEDMAHMQGQCEIYAAHMDHLAAQLQVTVQRKAEEERVQKHRLLMISTNKHAAILKEIERKMHEGSQLMKEQKAVKFRELKEEMERAVKKKQEQKEEEAEEDRNIAQEQQEIEKKKMEQENALRIQLEQYYQEKMKAAERAESLAKWKMQRCSLRAARKHHIQNTTWTPVQADTPSKTIEEEMITLPSPLTPDSIPEQPKTLEQEQEALGGALRRPHHMNTQGEHKAKECAFAPYHSQTERNVELLKESPNQEVSSVSDMTASLMSTSSDFVDTPFDENLPEFEADPKIQTIPESSVVENTNYAYMKSSIGAVLYDNGNGNLNLSPPYTITSPVDVPPIMLTESPDANANVSGIINIFNTQTPNEDHQGNTIDHSSNTATQNEDHQGNTMAHSKTTQNIDYQGSTATDDSNSNMAAQNLNELVIQFRERRAQAAAIKEKVLNECHHTTTTSKNNMNILITRAVPTSTTAKNKQRVLEREYGMTDAETQQEVAGGTRTYSRQVSSTSTSSFHSFSSSERLMSTSTVFTTPDEERPVLIDQEPTPLPSPCTTQTEVTPIKFLVEEALRNLPVQQKTPYYDPEYMKLMDQEPLLDITGSALRGKPNTRPSFTKEATTSTSSITTTTSSVTTSTFIDAPSTLELSCVPIYFIRSIRMHLAIQSRLVNESLLAEVLVQGSLLDHFSALRSLLLLHDAHFARALTTNLFRKLEPTTCPATLLVPAKLNNILNKSVAESCWSTNPQAENLSFVVTNIPPAFTHITSIVDCLELRYRVSWPHNLILNSSTLACYSRVWGFLASLHHAIWASDNLFCHTSFLSRQDKEGRLFRSPQFHQLCLHRHRMHHFIQALQAYVISQIHQISWSRLEEKLQSKVTSLDHLYALHSSFIEAIISRCFLSRKGQVVHRLIKEVFSCTLRFCSQFLAHSFVPEEQEGGGQALVHPAFAALTDTFHEFESHAAILHKLLVKVGRRVLPLSHQQELLLCIDFNEYYTKRLGGQR